LQYGVRSKVRAKKPFVLGLLLLKF